MNSNRFGLLSAALVLTASSAFAQTPAPTPRPEQTPAPRAQQEMTATEVSGTLESVNAVTKTLIVKTTAGKDETLRYDDTTKVIGGQSGIAGLANSKGTDVTVKFRGTGAERVATEITIKEKQ